MAGGGHSAISHVVRRLRHEGSQGADTACPDADDLRGWHESDVAAASAVARGVPRPADLDRLAKRKDRQSFLAAGRNINVHETAGEVGADI